MLQFLLTKTSTLIIIQVLLEVIFDKIYEVTVDAFKLRSNSLFMNIYISDDVWELIFIQFEVLSQLFPYY